MPELNMLEWTGMLLRWAHVVVALAWIGASFYLISWENKFNRENNLREGVEGDFWTIQGGDFYYVEKLRGAPDRLPRPLHWFKYEAYFTWLTGFALLCVFYYAQAPGMLLGPGSILNSGAAATGASIACLVTAWLVYALFARTALARNLKVSALLGIVFVALLAWVCGLLFNGRAAFLHVGAALGGIMSANVFFVIIPWHKRLVAAIEMRAPLDGIYLEHPGFRSRHNHYLTLPVLFLMVGLHAPLNFDHGMNWLVITLLTLSMGLFKHFHTRIQRRQSSLPCLLAGLLVFAGAALVNAWPAGITPGCSEPVATATVAGIMVQRCAACHRNAAGGSPVLVEPGQWLEHSGRIAYLVEARSMPPGNVTGMTKGERRHLVCWLEQARDGA